jgi:hypothetical protein
MAASESLLCLCHCIVALCKFNVFFLVLVCQSLILLFSCRWIADIRVGILQLECCFLIVVVVVVCCFFCIYVFIFVHSQMMSAFVAYKLFNALRQSVVGGAENNSGDDYYAGTGQVATAAEDGDGYKHHAAGKYKPFGGQGHRLAD